MEPELFVEIAGVSPTKPVFSLQLTKALTRVLYNTLGEQPLKVNIEPASIPPGSIVVFIQVPPGTDLKDLEERLEEVKTIFMIEHLKVKYF